MLLPLLGIRRQVTIVTRLRRGKNLRLGSSTPPRRQAALTLSNALSSRDLVPLARSRFPHSRPVERRSHAETKIALGRIALGGIALGGTALKTARDCRRHALSPWKVSGAPGTSPWKMSSSKMTSGRLSRSMRHNVGLSSTSTWWCRELCQILPSWTTSWRASPCGRRTWMFSGRSMSRWTTDSDSVP